MKTMTYLQCHLAAKRKSLDQSLNHSLAQVQQCTEEPKCPSVEDAVAEADCLSRAHAKAMQSGKAKSQSGIVAALHKARTIRN